MCKTVFPRGYEWYILSYLQLFKSAKGCGDVIVLIHLMSMSEKQAYMSAWSLHSYVSSFVTGVTELLVEQGNGNFFVNIPLCCCPPDNSLSWQHVTSCETAACSFRLRFTIKRGFFTQQPRRPFYLVWLCGVQVLRVGNNYYQSKNMWCSWGKRYNASLAELFLYSISGK